MAFLLPCAAHHLERVWTDEKGRKVKATLLNVDEDQVLLQLTDGREVPYPLEKLSKIDQAFIQKFGLAGHEDEDGESEQRSDDLNFGDKWPDRVSFKGDPEVVTVKEDANEEQFIYESASYRYHSDVRLSQSVVKGFAVMFEATYQFTRALPLAVNGGRMEDGKYQIFLFENEGDYIEAGGPPGSAGVFIGGSNVVMVPLTSLGVRKVGSGYMLDRDKSSKTLAHELVHQLTPPEYYKHGAMGWFTEGLAEYVAVTPYRSGSFNVRTNFRPILAYVTAYGEKNISGRALGEDISIGPLERFFKQPYSSFTANASLNYGAALLITNYFMHMDGDGDAANLKLFLKALRNGKEGDEALSVLLAGRSYTEMEEEISKAYSRKRVDLHFSK